MNWKNEAIDRLRQYPQARQARDNLQREIRRLEAALASPGSARPDRGRGSGKREDWMLDTLVNLELLRDRYLFTSRWLENTDSALAGMTREDRALLEQMYMSGEPDTQLLSLEYGADRSTLYRHRDRALERFTLALYGPVS